MSDVALRDYITEIDGMIEHSAYDTAIAHCRHILTQYPRYLEVYRTLGKAVLEKEDDEAALDIFQRVLSVDPEDFVARVGLSIIYDRRNDLDKAIWHMERAFDLMPSNEVIQSELKRLYGRRDGTEPERISLTRGALARMYAQGGLYPEAIADLHSLLQEQADRIDLQVLLAEILWRDEQPVEAAEWAQKVIAQLPYCLKANLVLGDVWQSNGQNEEGVASLKRAQAVDPDNVRAAHLFGPTSLLPYRTTTVSRMDQPSYGDMLTDASPRVEAEEVPDWLKGLADMGTPQIESPESLSAPRLPTGLHMPNTGPLQAEIPEWLQGLAPTAEPGVEAAAPAAEVPDWLVAMTGPATEEAQPDWMAQLPATAEPPTESAVAAAPAVAEIPDWLSQLGASADVEAVQPAAQEEVPDWLSQLSTGVATPTESAAQAPAETPDWMSQLRGAAPVEPEPEAAESVPDWLSQLQASAPSLPETEAALSASTPEAEVPDWLVGLQTPEPEPSMPVAESKDEPKEEVPDWLQSLQTLEKQAQSTVVSPHPSVLEHKIELDADRATVNRLVEAFEPKEESPAPPAAVGSAAAVTELPEEMPSADDALAFFARLSAGKEDQLRAQAEQEGTVRMDAIMGRKSAEAAPVTPAPASEPIVVPAPEAEAPDWLSQLTTPPVEAAAEPTPAPELPGWLQSLQPFEPIEPVAAEETTVVESVAEPTPAEELPEWLREVQSQETIAAPASASELPEWLRELQPLPSDAEPVPEETAAVESAAVAAPTPSLVMREDEEPLAYLQRLADEKQARLAGAVQPQVSEAQAAPVETPAPPVAESPAAPVAAASVAAETAASIPEAMPSADDALAFFARLSAGKEDQLRAQAEQEATVRMDAIMGRKSVGVAPAAAVSQPEPEPEPQPEVKPIEAAPVAVLAESAPAAPVPVTPPVAAVKPAARRAAPEPVAAPPAEVKPPAPVVEPEPSAPPPAETQPVVSAAETGAASTLPASWWIQSAEDEGEEPMAELPVPYLAPRPAPSGPVMTRLKRDRSRTRELTQPAAPPPAPPTPAVVSVNLEPLLVRLQYNKNDHDARLQLARAYWAMGDRAQSLVTYAQLAAANVLTEDLMADLERVVEIYQDADWFRLLGDVYMKNSRLPRALDMYRRALTQL